MNSLILPSRFFFFTLCFLTGCISENHQFSQKDVTFYGTGKVSRYQQHSDGSLEPLNPLFFAEIFITEGGNVNDATVIMPDEQESTIKPMPSRSIPIQEEKIYDVIVIGAGISGIAAADKLDSEGLDVLILEARDRTGGRTWTMYWDEAGIPVDMGAGWIHGSGSHNPITVIAQENGIELFETDLNSGVLLGPDGEWIEDELWNEMEVLYKDFQEYRWEYAETTNQDESVKDAEESFAKVRNLSDVQKSYLRFYINTALEHEENADSHDLSLWTDPGGAHVGLEHLFPKGYVQVLDTLDDGLDIRLEHVVSKVQYDQNGVTVITNKGDFNSKYVISTLPMGVLKAGDVEFSPPLPTDKQQAIDRIGMGLLNKLYLLFDEMFWDDVVLINYISEDSSPMWEFFNLNGFGEPILLGFTTGDHAREFEQLSDDEIIADAMSHLERMYGEDTLQPISYVRTSWASDQYAKGAYSYAGVGVTEADYAALAEPVMNRVFFAGEATYIDQLATVHGAYLSGLREAERISELEN